MKYYWCARYCNQCGRSERYEVGAVDGDVFLFRQYPNGIGDVVSPPVVTWSDWQKMLVRSPEDRNDPLYRVPWGHIEREDGEVIPPDEFEEMVSKLLHGSLYAAEVK